MSIRQDIGIVTAYGYAVSKGYQGTEEEFAEAMAAVGTNVDEITDAIDTFINQTVPAATQAVTDEGIAQIGAVNQAGADQVDAVEDKGTIEIGAVEAAGTAQIGLVNGAGTTQVNAVNGAGTTQVGNVNTAGTTQVGNVNTAGSTQVAAVNAKGEEVIQSIPADYTELSQEVDSLNDGLNNTLDVLFPVETNIDCYTGTSVGDSDVAIWTERKLTTMPKRSFLKSVSFQSDRVQTIEIGVANAQTLAYRSLGYFDVVSGTNDIDLYVFVEESSFVTFKGRVKYNGNSGSGYTLESYTLTDGVLTRSQSLNNFGLFVSVTYLNEAEEEIEPFYKKSTDHKYVTDDFGYQNGCYYSWSDGTLIANNDYCYSEFIKIEPDFWTSLSLFGNSGSVNSICFFDENKTFISGNFASLAYIVPNNAAYFTVSIPISSKNNFYLIALKVVNNTINVGKDEAIKTINDALKIAYLIESISNPVTIIVFPGVYNEVLFIQGTHYVSIIGTNRDDCIIRNDTALYNNAPLRIQGQCYVANLSIISTADNYSSETGTGASAWKTDVLNGVANPQWLNTIGAYAVHCDDVTNGEKTVSRFENCYMYSSTFPAFGSGMQINNRIELVNCELVSDIDAEIAQAKPTDNGQGCLLIHGRNNGTGMSVFIKDCYVESVNCKSVHMYPVGSSNDASIIFINNTFMNNQDLTQAQMISFSFDTALIEKCSHGNNLDFLNKVIRTS